MDTGDTRVAIVTGAGRGIGAAAATELSRRGFRVTVNYRQDETAAKDVVRLIEADGGVAIAVAGDMRHGDDAQRLVARTVAEFGRLDALVCNANVGLALGPIDAVGWETFAGKVTDELAVAFHPTTAALPVMRERHYGRIVYLSSEAAKGPVAIGMGAHSTAKAALNAYGRIVAREAGPYGVVANVLSCGFVRTDANARLPEERLRVIADRTPLGRLAVPADIARVIAFLCGEDAGFMTGTITPVDGGADVPLR